MSKADTSENGRSSGVNELIARLHDEGVEAGRKEADVIRERASAEAAAIRQAARADADAVREAARKEAAAYRQAGNDALQAAIRDALLDLKVQMSERFRADIRRLVSHEMKDPAFLRQMILELVGRSRPAIDQAQRVEAILPEEVVGLEVLRDRMDELEKSPLTDFVRGVASELIREGVTLSWSEDLTAGAHIFLEGEDVTIDLSDAAVADMLARYLQPRFRAILEGVVK